MTPIVPNLSVRRFYFLDYFYILLISVSRHQDKVRVFSSFKELKQQYRLGESKFKKLTADPPELTPTQLKRYQYTFDEVVQESKEYNLVSEPSPDRLVLTSPGNELLGLYNTDQFLPRLFSVIERHKNAYRYIISQMYNANKARPGVLFLPIYSPHQLGMDRRSLRTTGDIRAYGAELATRLSRDLESHLAVRQDLSTARDDCIQRIIASELLSSVEADPFAPRKYNAIVHRFRKFWLSYFLKDVYELELSLSTFELWSYRGKQFGVIHATDFYPTFRGRVVFPTSVLVSRAPSSDFRLMYDYGDAQLYAHIPTREVDQEPFIGALVTSYHTLRRTQRAFFVHLASLREMVCYQLKISEATFGILLDKAYQQSLAGNLQVRISLEVDKLPEDTRDAYLKQEPVVVDGKPRNIIAIETKGRTNG